MKTRIDTVKIYCIKFRIRSQQDVRSQEQNIIEIGHGSGRDR